MGLIVIVSLAHAIDRSFVKYCFSEVRRHTLMKSLEHQSFDIFPHTDTVMYGVYWHYSILNYVVQFICQMMKGCILSVSLVNVYHQHCEGKGHMSKKQIEKVMYFIFSKGSAQLFRKIFDVGDYVS